MPTQKKRSYPAQATPSQPLRLAPRPSKKQPARNGNPVGMVPEASPLADANGQPLSRELILRLIEWLEQG